MLFEFPHVSEVMAVMVQYLLEVLTLWKWQMKTRQDTIVCEMTQDVQVLANRQITSFLYPCIIISVCFSLFCLYLDHQQNQGKKHSFLSL